MWAVAVKELRQIRRDRRTLLILVFVPTFFLFLYGYALNFDVRHIALAVEDRDQSADSRSVIADFVRSTYFDVVAVVTSPEEVTALVDRGTARVVLVIPSDFSRDIRERQTAEVQIIVDGDNANTATTVLGYVTAVLRTSAAELGAQPTAAMATIEPRVWYNPELRSTVFLVPGLIAFISMITAVISTALSIVREKERGTMEQVRMAPISTLTFVVGKNHLAIGDVFLGGGLEVHSFGGGAMFICPIYSFSICLQPGLGCDQRVAGLEVTTVDREGRTTSAVGFPAQ